MGLFLLWATRGRINTWLFLTKLVGITRRGVLKELELCDFGQHVNEMMAVTVKNFLNF